jgi:hypothetical protein
VAVAAGLVALGLTGCADRVAGQVELLTFAPDGYLQRYSRATDPVRAYPIPGVNEPIRSNDDIVTIQVESAYIQNLPFRLTGSKDVIIFADVWENAAMGFNGPSSLTSIVYIGPNQKVPGRLNFRDMLAYGPTKFKGHPLRVRFTMMVLQKSTATRQASAIDVISSLASIAAPQYSMITSEVAKLLQGILRSQPDIKFFDFDVTFSSDRPESLVDIVPKAQAGAPASTTFRAEPKGDPDKIHWLRYGRYALVETESHDGKGFKVINVQASQVNAEDAWLYGPDGALPTSYLIFRITPQQLDEKNEVLRAASDANVKLLESLRRSDTEVAAAIKEIQASAANLQDQVVRARAESIAYKVFREAQSRKETDCQKVGKTFDANWGDEMLSLETGLRERATKIGESSKKRWVEKCSGAGGMSGAPAAPAPTKAWLTESGNRDRIKTELAGRSITVEALTFKIDRVSAVAQSAAGANNPFDTVKVVLSATGPAGATVARAAVEAEIAKAANKVVSDNSNDKGVIKAVEIENRDEAALKNRFTP